MGNGGINEKDSSDGKHKAAEAVAVFLMNSLLSCFMVSVAFGKKDVMR